MTSRLGLAMVAVALVSLLVSSGGFSSVAMERSIEVAVADDASEQAIAFEDGENGTWIEVTNRAAADLTIERATVADSRLTRASDATARPPAGPIEPGGNATIELTGVRCDEVTGGTIPVDITATTGSATIETTVDATVDCDE